MKKFFVVFVAVVALLLVTSSAVRACDQNCIEKAAAGNMSQEELKQLGYGNVVRALTNANHGDIGLSLWQIGLWGSYPAWNVNTIFGTKVPDNCVGFFLQEDGSILAYGLDEKDVLHTYVCNYNAECIEQK